MCGSVGDWMAGWLCRYFRTVSNPWWVRSDLNDIITCCPASAAVRINLSTMPRYVSNPSRKLNINFVHRCQHQRTKKRDRADEKA